MTQFAASTHAGLVRDHNEDCFAADPNAGIWLVADGVGGHSFGEVASAIVKATVSEAFAKGDMLIDAIHKAHHAVLSEIGEQDEKLGMGSTVVACTVSNGNYQVAWVGDSRAYLWDGEVLKQLTRDHTHVYDLVDRGLISSQEAAIHPERHVLTQSLGVFHDMELLPGSASGHIEEGQQILLCSDGLTDELSDSAIAVQLRHNHSTQSQVDGLLSAALSSGGRDNITVVVVGEAAAGDEPELAAPHPDLNTTQNVGQSAPDRPMVSRAQKFWGAVIVGAILAAIAWI